MSRCSHNSGHGIIPTPNYDLRSWSDSVLPTSRVTNVRTARLLWNMMRKFYGRSVYSMEDNRMLLFVGTFFGKKLSKLSGRQQHPTRPLRTAPSLRSYSGVGGRPNESLQGIFFFCTQGTLVLWSFSKNISAFAMDVRQYKNISVKVKCIS